MIKAIMGLKGSGKTKALADMANRAVAHSRGNVVYIEKGKTLMFDINHRARLVNIDDYGISDYEGLYGFLAGLVAGNHDITDVFIDSVTKICTYDISDIEAFLVRADALSKLDDLDITVTISGDAAEATEGIRKYLIEI